MLQEDEPLVVESMLRYIYTFDYSDATCRDSDTIKSPMLQNVHVHKIAHKYDIPGVAKLAHSKFEQSARANWKYPSFADAAMLVFTSAADRERQLRDTVISVATEHAGELKEADCGAHFREAVGAVPSLGLALWQKQAVVETKRCRCLACGWPVPWDCVDDRIGQAFHCMDCGARQAGVTWKNNVV